MTEKEDRIKRVALAAEWMGLVFKLWRQEKHLGINAFGKRYGMGHSAIAYIEDGKATSTYNMFNLLIIHGRSFDDLYLAVERLKAAYKLIENVKNCDFEEALEVTRTKNGHVVEKKILEAKKELL